MDALSRGGGEGREVCYGNLLKTHLRSLQISSLVVYD